MFLHGLELSDLIYLYNSYQRIRIPGCHADCFAFHKKVVWTISIKLHRCYADQWEASDLKKWLIMMAIWLWNNLQKVGLLFHSSLRGVALRDNEAHKIVIVLFWWESAIERKRPGRWKYFLRFTVAPVN